MHYCVATVMIWNWALSLEAIADAFHYRSCIVERYYIFSSLLPSVFHSFSYDFLIIFCSGPLLSFSLISLTLVTVFRNRKCCSKSHQEIHSFTYFDPKCGNVFICFMQDHTGKILKHVFYWPRCKWCWIWNRYQVWPCNLFNMKSGLNFMLYVVIEWHRI